MNYKHSPPLEFWLPANPESVPAARRKAMRACADAGLSDDDCFMLDLALGEALANAVLHGTSSADEEKENEPQVYMSLWTFQSRLIIQVRDCGIGYDPPAPPYIMPEASQEDTHGRGLPLMETLTDALAICRGCVQEGGSSVFLIKRQPH